MPEMGPHETDLFGESVSYEVRRSEEASEPRIDIDIHDVVVVLPSESQTDPETLLAENAAWVVEKKHQYNSYREDAPERRFEPGTTFPYLGDSYEVVVDRRPSSDIDGDTFKLAEHHVERTSVKRALKTLYRRKARELFETRASQLADEMGVVYENIELRNQRTRWGSCSTSGTLSLNWRLMMAPLSIVDSILIHELAHLREPNHTEAFWSLIAHHNPQYEEHAEWLEENSTRLIFSEEDL